MHHTPLPTLVRARPAGVLVAVLMILGACALPPKVPADRALLTYESSPAGAHIIEGGQDLGQAPVTRTYHLDAGATRITTPDVIAVWPSGAKTTFFTFLDPGTDRQAVLNRPAGAPGLDVDEAHALDVEASRKAAELRIKEQNLHDEARMSARCQQQQAGNPSTTDNCQ